MTNQQLLLSIGLPMMLILVGILLNERSASNLRSDMKDLRSELKDEMKDVRAEMKDMRAELVSRIDRIDSDLATFYKVTGVLEGRLDELGKR